VRAVLVAVSVGPAATESAFAISLPLRGGICACSFVSPSDLKIVSPSQVTSLKKAGFNPETMKVDAVGTSSKADLYYDPNDGDIYVVGKQGIGEPQPTGVRYGPSGVPEIIPLEVPPADELPIDEIPL
jgi:hypothetical protein